MQTAQSTEHEEGKKQKRANWPMFLALIGLMVLMFVIKWLLKAIQ